MSVLSLACLIGFAGCDKVAPSSCYCPPNSAVCYDVDGTALDPNCAPLGDGGDRGPIEDTDGNPTDGDPTTEDTEPPPPPCTPCAVSATDSDGDCILNSVETSTSPTNADTDGDGIPDNCEDLNLNGTVDAGESNPTVADTDGDGIPDGTEDKNHNGRFEINHGETSPVLVDSDRDGIPDGGANGEDKNNDGVVTPFVDTNGNGCWDLGEPQGETSASTSDTDGDGIGDGKEDANHNGTCDLTENSCAFTADSDCDTLPDGSEDASRNGAFNTGETEPRNPDTDGDLIPDGIEDTNKNGIFESGTETDPRAFDSDTDGIPDGQEDANHNGIVDPPPRGADGCWTGAAPGETDPRLIDTDGDQIPDNLEDKDKNSQCDSGTIADPNAPGGQRTGLIESCAFLADTDCDGIPDGHEDKNHDGIYQLAETDSMYNDTDRDGLIDGCPLGFDFTRCEDLSNDGRVDLGETDPRSVDTDLDGLNDHCEVTFAGGATNALVEDTDGDGKTDGEEDANHNCTYEPNLQETDPRVVNPPPAPGTPEYPRSQVCDSQNLKQLTFAEAPDTAVDYRVAFEVEKFNGVSASYFTTPFGIELTSPNNQILVDDPNDMVWGHTFESPVGVVVDPAVGATPINRNVYGFVYATADATTLDATLDDLRDRMTAAYGGAVVEVSNLPARPAHDNLQAFRVVRAQRQYRITVAASASNAWSGVRLRQDVMARIFLPVDELSNVRPTSVLADTTTDPVYGSVTCPGSPQCYQKFTMSIAAVQRPDQIVVPAVGATPAVKGVTLYVVAITPDDSTSNANDTLTRLYNERLTRLDDLTGGSAVARYEARRSSTCEDRNATRAKADLLFVVDDSGSMQAVIDKLQQASRDAQAVLTANSNNVDYRIAMTTTNPSIYGRTVCDSGTQGTISPSTFNSAIGCMKICPANCSPTCTDSGGVCNVSQCGSVCQPDIVNLRNTESAVTDSNGLFTYELPGGGGTFYYEDTAWLDCDGTSAGIAACNGGAFASEFSTFFGGQPRKRLFGNSGFLGADPTAVCPTAPVDLSAKTSDANTSCDSNPLTPDCCDRLIDTCTDGPRVLSSQMCDLIRAMGGRPQPGVLGSSSRPNSSNESGVRMARKLIGTLVPALPSNDPDPKKQFHLRMNCSTVGGGEACDTDSDCGSYDFCDLGVLTNGRGVCKPTGNCQACDPRAGTTAMVGNAIGNDSDHLPIAGASCSPGPCTCTADAQCGRGERCGPSGSCIVDCSPVPLVTLFLSDEEDYFFKDECASSPFTPPILSPIWQASAQQTADESEMPTECYYRIRNPDANGNEQPEPCADPAIANPFSYCSAYMGGTDYTALATGYDPDFVPSDNSEVMKWRAYNAPECAYVAPNYTTPPTNTCAGDPCRLITTAGACTPGATNGVCTWNVGVNACVNFCNNYTASGGTNPTTLARQQQRDACNADLRCVFDPGMGSDGRSNGDATGTVTDQRFACIPRVPINDCQACKRMKRRYQVVLGEDPAGVSNDIIGFDDVGPVYAIARDRGKEGFRAEGQTPGQDQCAGGSITWGRGDGQAFRDIAVDTLGRAQNVCATSYQDFMQLVVTDIVALSAPYRLSESPIAATLKVGIGRPNGDGTWTFIDVPRSKTRGFVYDSTSNSIGFKSDPVDGLCPGFSCSANGVIEDGEVQAARAASEVPKTNDLVFISYRFWRPVPCPQGCLPDETCVRSLCPADNTPVGSCVDSSTCTEDRVCINSQCQYQCTDDGYLERCVPNPCTECQTYNSLTGACTDIGDACVCFFGPGIPCDPTGPNTCPPGLSCDESCVCQPIAACLGAFNADGTVADCNAALACCQALSDCSNILTQPNCTAAAPTCSWNASSGKCEGAGGTCCGPNDTAVCYTPIEDPSRKVFACQGAECSCTQGPLCNSDSDCGPATPNNAHKCIGTPGDKHCTCNPQTEVCLPDAGTGCACQPTPG